MCTTLGENMAIRHCITDLMLFSKISKPFGPRPIHLIITKSCNINKYSNKLTVLKYYIYLHFSIISVKQY